MKMVQICLDLFAEKFTLLLEFRMASDIELGHNSLSHTF